MYVCGGESEREGRGREIDRQTQIFTQAGIHTGRQTDKQTDRFIYCLTDKQTEKSRWGEACTDINMHNYIII